MSQTQPKATSKKTQLNKPAYIFIALKSLLESIQQTGLTFTGNQWVAITKTIRNLGDIGESIDQRTKPLEEKYGEEVEVSGTKIYKVQGQDAQMAMQKEVTEIINEPVDCEIYQLNAVDFENDNQVNSVPNLHLFYELMLFVDDDPPKVEEA